MVPPKDPKDIELKISKSILHHNSTTDHTSGNQHHPDHPKFDEENVSQTYHPADKDYGHLKPTEPRIASQTVLSDPHVVQKLMEKVGCENNGSDDCGGLRQLTEKDSFKESEELERRISRNQLDQLADLTHRCKGHLVQKNSTPYYNN